MSAAAPQPPESRESREAIEGYDLVEKLGQGGSGVVYRARVRGSGEQVALKTVRLVRETHLASLRREIQALSRVRHPGIVAILDVGASKGGIPWYTMELLHGEPFSKWLGHGSDELSADSTGTPTQPSEPSAPSPPGAARQASRPAQRRRPRGELLSVVRKLCTPLSYLHGQGIVHRDLKPSNVFVRLNGNPVLLDFGLVWPTERDTGVMLLEAQLAQGGTVGYMAPEQIRGELVDARADLYALGCILYEAVTGRLPFVGETKADVLEQHLHQRPDSPAAVAPGIEPELENLIMSLLDKQPSRRIGYADDVAAALGRLGTEGWSDPAAPPPRPYVYRPAFVGRDDLIRDVTSRLNEAHGAGRGSVILVGGQSGIGKTTFVAAVARLARARGFAVVAGECHRIGLDGGSSAGRPLSLGAFSSFLRAVLDRCLSRGPAVASQLLGERGQILTICEPELTKVRFDRSFPAATHLPGLDARRRILDALAVTLMRYAEEKPLLLVIDDLQWTDELSRRFLTDFPPDLLGGPLVILATYRTEAAGALAEVMAAPHVVKLSLANLDRPSLATATAAMLGLDTAVPVVDFIADHSAGNPFFAAEYLRAAISAGFLVRREGGRWEIASERGSLDALPLPGTLNDLIVHRLDHLPRLCSAVVGIAAVVGREATLDMLIRLAARAAGETDEGLVLDALNELKARQILEDAGGNMLRFVHDKLREACYERLPPDDRRRLHLEAARLLEELVRGETGEEAAAATLAHHFERGGDPAQAIVYLDKAAEHSRRSFSNAEVVRLLGTAVALADGGVPIPAATRARWHRLLGEAYSGLGRHAESLAELQRAVSLLGYAVPQSTAGAVGALLAAVARQALHRAMPRLFVGRRRERAEHLREAARSYDLLMPVTYYVTGSLPRILLASVRHVNLAELAGPSPELALAYANAQATAGLVPWHRLAVTYERAAEDALLATTDEVARTWVLVMSSVYHLGLGGWEIARRAAAHAQGVSARLQFHRRWEEATGILGTIEFLSGTSDDAHELYEAQLRSAVRGDGQTHIWAAAGMAQALLRMDRAREARLRAEEAAQLLDGRGRPERIFARGVLALALWRDGQPAAAVDTAEQALALMREGAPISFYCINAYACVAETLVEAAAAQPSAAAVARARAACVELARSARVFPVSAPAHALWRGRLAAVSGRHGRAATLYAQGLSSAERLAMSHEAEMARALLAKRA